MTTSPYAKVKLIIDGGSAVYGGQVIAGGNTVRLRGENTAFWTEQTWEIYEFPTGFSPGAGWTNINGIWTNTDVDPPDLSIPAPATMWGKYLFRLIVNQGLLNGEFHGPDNVQPLVDVSAAVHVKGQSGLYDVGFGETNQFDPIRLWVGELKETLRILDNAVFAAGGSGETNTMANIGTGADVYKEKIGVQFRVRRLKAGNANITVTQNADDISISATGEANTASNVGSGVNVFKDKNGVDLRFRRLLAGSGVTLTENANDITVTSTGSGTPGGNNREVQFNNAGTLAGASEVEISTDGNLVVGASIGTPAASGSVRSALGAQWMSRLGANDIGIINTLNSSGLAKLYFGSYGDLASAKTFDEAYIVAKNTGLVSLQLGSNSADGKATLSKLGATPLFTLNSQLSLAINGATPVSAEANLGGGKGVVYWGNANAVPSANPPAGAVIAYFESETLKYRKSDGTIVVLDGTVAGVGGGARSVQFNNGGTLGGSTEVKIDTDGNLIVGDSLGTVATTGSIRSRGAAFRHLSRSVISGTDKAVYEHDNDGLTDWISIGSYDDYADAKTVDETWLVAKTGVFTYVGGNTPWQVVQLTSGGTTNAALVSTTANFGIMGSHAGLVGPADFGGGAGVFLWGNANTVPTTNPSSGIIAYVEGGVLKYRKTDGTIVVLSGGGGGSPGGSADEIQINNGSGGFGGATRVKAGTDYISVGTAPATFGHVRLPGDGFVYSRDGNPGGSNVRLLGLDVASQEVWMATQGYNIRIFPGTARTLYLQSDTISMIDAAGTPHELFYLESGGSKAGRSGIDEWTSTNDAKGTERNRQAQSTQTTDASPTNVGSFTPLANNTGLVASWMVVAIKSDGSAMASYSVTASFRQSSGGVVTLEGTPIVTPISTALAVGGVTAATDATNVYLTITGIAATNIRWSWIRTSLEVIP